MGWSIGYDEHWKRDIGYGVPAQCDHPKCTTEIDRGQGYVCGGQPFGGDDGCGLYFCTAHLAHGHRVQICGRCLKARDPWPAKPDLPVWIRHKLKDKSWSTWRQMHSEQVRAMRAALKATA